MLYHPVLNVSTGYTGCTGGRFVAFCWFVLFCLVLLFSLSVYLFPLLPFLSFGIFWIVILNLLIVRFFPFACLLSYIRNLVMKRS